MWGRPWSLVTPGDLSRMNGVVTAGTLGITGVTPVGFVPDENVAHRDLRVALWAGTETVVCNVPSHADHRPRRACDTRGHRALSQRVGRQCNICTSTGVKVKVTDSTVPIGNADRPVVNLDVFRM